MSDEKPVARISLCMIVRDEEEMLPQFLHHAEGLWDELIVVDTGSKDGSRKLLEDAGAKVISRDWDDDFAAARNAALEQATGGFILSLDADEFISTELKSAVRSAVLDPKLGAANLVVRNHLPHGHHRDAPLLRLFRNDKRIRYRFPIHEEVASSLLPVLEEGGLTLATLAGVVDHQGYVRERAAGRGKKERDLRILAKCLMDDPGDVYSQYKRLELARYWDDRALWDAAAQEAEALLVERPDALQGQHFGGDFLVLLAQTKPAKESLTFVDAHAPRVPPSAELHYFRGQLLEAERDYAGATRAFEACMAVEGVRNIQMATVRPRMGLCRIAMAQGDRSAALAHASTALQEAPRDPEVLLALCSLHAMAGPDATEDFVESYTAEHTPGETFWLAVGNAGMIYGDVPGAIAAYERAAGDPPEGRPAMHLAKAVVRSGDYSRAHGLLEPLVAQIPEAGIALLVCEMCMDQDSNLNLNLSEAEADHMLREWVVTALFGANDETLANLARRVPTIEHAFPWLPEALGLAA